MDTTGVFCPECGQEVSLSAGVKIGQRLACAGCKARLEVIGLSPLEVDLVFAQPKYVDDEWEWCGEDSLWPLDKNEGLPVQSRGPELRQDTLPER